MKNILINFSNHDSKKWCKRKRILFDEIVDMKFPDSREEELMTIEIINSTIKSIRARYTKEDIEIFFYISGEQSLSFALINYYIDLNYRCVTPFEYVRWREIKKFSILGD